MGDYGACVHSRVDIMDRATTLTSSRLDRLGPRVEAREFWKEGGVNVDDTPWEGVEKRGPEKSHESGKANQLNARLFQ